VNESSGPTDGSPVLTCITCSKPLQDGWAFCPACGTHTVPFSTRTAIDDYIENKLDIDISARLKDQNSIVRELSDKA
jgi:hypothetical protein